MMTAPMSERPAPSTMARNRSTLCIVGIVGDDRLLAGLSGLTAGGIKNGAKILTNNRVRLLISVHCFARFLYAGLSLPRALECVFYTSLKRFREVTGYYLPHSVLCFCCRGHGSISHE